MGFIAPGDDDEGNYSPTNGATAGLGAAPTSAGAPQTAMYNQAYVYQGLMNQNAGGVVGGTAAPNSAIGAAQAANPSTSAPLSSGSAGDYGSVAGLLPSDSSQYYDPGAAAYAYNGLNEGYFNQKGIGAQTRTNTIDTSQTGADQQAGAAAAAQQQQAYNTQQAGANLALAQANGTAPSVAQAQLQQGLDQSNQGAASLAAGARGSGTGLAQILASQQQSQNQLSTNNQAAQLRASEIQQGTSAYNSAAQGLSSTAAGVRAGDQSQQAQDAQQAQAQATANQANTSENDAYQQGEQKMGQTASAAQQQGNINYQSNEGANYNAQSATNAGLSASNAQTTSNIVGGLVSGAAGLAMAASDVNAKTGVQSLTTGGTQATPANQMIGAAIQPGAYSYGGAQMPQTMPKPATTPAYSAPATMDQQPTHAFGSDPSEVASQPGGALAPGGPTGGGYGQAQWNQQRAQTNTMPGTATKAYHPSNLGGIGGGIANAGTAIGTLLHGQNTPAPSQPSALAGLGSAIASNPSADMVASDVNSKMGITALQQPVAAGANQSSPGNALSDRSYGPAAVKQGLAQPVAPNHAISNAQAAKLAAQADSMQKQMAYQYGGPQGVAAPANDPSPQVGSFLNSLQPYSFQYKNDRLDPTDPGQHYGVMAQNVASTPMGASLIDRTNGGGLAIDMKRAVPAVMAGEADLNARVKQLEAQLAAQTGQGSAGVGSTPAAYRYGGGQ